MATSNPKLYYALYPRNDELAWADETEPEAFSIPTNDEEWAEMQRLFNVGRVV